jgi:hypothetical protein
MRTNHWIEYQNLRDRFYEEIDDLWSKIYELEGEERDLPGVPESRGCIKIIL